MVGTLLKGKYLCKSKLFWKFVQHLVRIKCYNPIKKLNNVNAKKN